MKRIDKRLPMGVLLALTVSSTICGCGKRAPVLPETYPVTGTVQNANGSPLAKGLIQLELESNPSLNVSGTIVDGKFAVSTSFGNGVSAGAMPGRYMVTITPAFEATPKSVRLPELSEVKNAPTELLLTLPPAT